MSNEQEQPADAGRLQQRVRPAPEKMLPFEWLYWSLVDAKMHREAEGMDFALRQIKFMSEEANWQADRRLAAQREVERLRSLLLRLQHWDHMDSAADGPYWKREIDAALKA